MKKYLILLILTFGLCSTGYGDAANGAWQGGGSSAGGTGDSSTTEILWNNDGTVDGNSNLVTNGTNVGVGVASADIVNLLHVSTGDSGITSLSSNANELLVEGSAGAGITISAPSSKITYLVFADEIDNLSAFIRYDPSNLLMQISTHQTNGELALEAGTGAEKVRISAAGMGVGSTVSPTGTASKVLWFGDNAGDPTMGADTCGIYGTDTAGTVELTGIDEDE
ncbi:unnamed protein product, partial [marine sediment metagenome]